MLPQKVDEGESATSLTSSQKKALDSFPVSFVEKAQSRIILIDDYVDARILNLFFDKAPTATIDCYVKRIHQTASMQSAFIQFHTQHPNVHCEMHDFELSHDRWLIIDDQLYNFGASLKDLGKRWFSFSVINDPGVKSHILSELI